MREIELKFKIDNLDKIVCHLESIGCEISNPIVQSDCIFVENLNNTESTQGSVWLRIRKTDDKIQLNYKKQSTKKMESEEIEFEVGSYDAANSFLTALGFKKWVEVNKKRRHTKYKDCNICIDCVEKLGDFIELELLVEENDSVDYEKYLLSLAEELKIDTNDRINSHYDTMISELNDEMICG